MNFFLILMTLSWFIGIPSAQAGLFRTCVRLFANSAFKPEIPEKEKASLDVLSGKVATSSNDSPIQEKDWWAFASRAVNVYGHIPEDVGNFSSTNAVEIGSLIYLAENPNKRNLSALVNFLLKPRHLWPKAEGEATANALVALDPTGAGFMPKLIESLKSPLPEDRKGGMYKQFAAVQTMVGLLEGTAKHANAPQNINPMLVDHLVEGTKALQQAMERKDFVADTSEIKKELVAARSRLPLKLQAVIPQG